MKVRSCLAVILLSMSSAFSMENPTNDVFMDLVLDDMDISSSHSSNLSQTMRMSLNNNFMDIDEESYMNIVEDNDMDVEGAKNLPAYIFYFF